MAAMSLYIVAVILLSGMLLDFPGSELADARRLPQRHHSHHQRWTDPEESMFRLLPQRRSDGPNRRWRLQDPRSNGAHEDVDDRERVSRRHHFDVHKNRTEGYGGAYLTRTKRHHADVSKHKNEKKGKRALIDMGSSPLDAESEYKLQHELEENEATNVSICSYTVKRIEDENGSWILRHLRNIKCDNVGSKCHKYMPHRCIQTYRNIRVKPDDKDTMKIYTGCVCGVLFQSTLNLDEEILRNLAD